MMDGTEDVPQQDLTEKAKKVVNEAKEKMAPVAEQAQATVTELKQNWTNDDQQKFNNLMRIITTASAVGVLWYTRKHFKFVKKVVRNNDANIIGAQEAIHALKEAGQKFTFYPGVGVYVD